MAFIEVHKLSKQFKMYKRQKGLWGAVRSLFYRTYDCKHAVRSIDFQIRKGELVGYIGPNGAGKSTTIKMLSGILVPTSGEIVVDGRIPYLQRKENAMHIGVVFGQRSQLYWDLPMQDTFELYKKMYRIDDARYRRNVDFYTDLLDMHEFISRPVRQLSLGQKMRANLAIILLHDPEIIYLDEPTIGLDVLAKSTIRQFIKTINREKETTVMLTTHDMDDIEEICDRLIMIDQGQILYDGRLDVFKETYSQGHMLIVEFSGDGIGEFRSEFSVLKEEGLKKWFLFKPSDIGVGEAMSYFAKHFPIVDIALKEPDIEEIVRELYGKKSLEGVNTV